MKRSPGTTGRLRVALFGGPSIHAGARAVRLSPYQQAATALVYGHAGGNVPRDRLIWFLWEADDTAAARHRLSQLLYAATARVDGQPLFLVQGDQVAPNTPAVECDMLTLERLTQSGSHLDAAQLIDAGFLSGLQTSITREFDDWRDARSLTLRAKVRDAAAKAWSDAEATADWRRARDAAEALLTLDPDSEPYLRCVMKARALTGAPEEAEAAFRGWVERTGPRASSGRPKILSSLRTDLSRWTLEGSTPRPARESDPPFLGRVDEMKQLLQHVRGATTGFTTLLISGEPGIGKTRLVHELCRLAESEGVPALKARCGRLEQQIPLTAFADALRRPGIQTVVDRLDEPWRSVIRHILPELAPGRPSLDADEPAVVSRRLFEALRRLLAELATERVILWLDDFQWADHTTATALEYCRRRWEKGAMILVLSYRLPTSQLDESITVLLRGVRSAQNEIELQPLKAEQTLRLASSVLGHVIPSTKHGAFLRLTDNIPLYTVELAHELSQGRLTLTADPSGLKGLSIALQGIVDDRLRLLSDFERRMLEFIACADGLEASVLTALLGEVAASVLPKNDVAEALEGLVNLRLVSETGSAVQCKHELIRQGVYDRVSRARRVLLHRQIGEALRERNADLYLDQIALHFDRAQLSPDAFQFAFQAALKAEETGAYPEAIRFLQIARKHAPGRTEAAQLLGREASIRYKQAEFERALPLLGLAEQEFRQVGDKRDAIGWGIRGIHAACETGALDYRDSLARLDAILDECDADQLWEQYIEGLECRLRILERQNRVDEMQPTFDRLARVPISTSARVRCLAQSVRALSVAFGMTGEGALEAANEALELARQHQLSDLYDRVLHRVLFVHVYRGTVNVLGGRERLDEGLGRAARSDSLKTRYGFLEAAGLWHLESGEYAAAQDFFQQAEEVMRFAPEVSDKVQMLANRAEQFVMEGHLALAMDYYLRARAAMLPQHAWRAHQTVLGGLGYCALELGDLRLARDCEGLLEYQNEGYFDPTVIVLFRATVMKRRGDIAGAADYVGSVLMGLESRLRMVAIKLRLLEARLRLASDRLEARRLAEWVCSEATTLALPARVAEARRLLRQTRLEVR